MARDRQSYQTYWQELAAKSGLSQDKIKAISEVLGDETAGKVFVEGFVAQSDYSRDLDKTRDEWKGKADEAAAAKVKYDEWYAKEAKPIYERNLKSWDELQKYRDLYGALDVTTPDGNRGGGNNPAFLTKADLDKILADRSSQDGVAYSRIVKDAAWITSDYVTRFPGKPPIDWDELEKIVVTQGKAPKDAYKQLIEPLIEERRTTEIEDRVKRERAAAVQEYQSTHQFPADSRPKGFHAIYDQAKAPENMTEGEREKAGRDEFLRGFEEANK